MATSVSGVSSIDVNSIVSQLMEVERRPIAQLGKKEAAAQSRLSAYGGLKGALFQFQSAMQAVTPGKFTGNTTSMSDLTVLTASAGPTAAPGVYDVTVTNVAASHVLKSAGVTSETAASSTGTITLQVGGGALTTITIDSTNNTLRGMRDAINKAAAGVTASIINDGTTNRLVLTGDKAGAANTIVVTNTLSAGELKTAADGFTIARAAQNADLTVNGVAVSSATNTITTAVTGVTINVTKAGTSKITVAQDTASAQTSVQAFVRGYNDLQKTITDLTKYDPATKRAGLLSGDSATAAVLAGVRSSLGAAVDGLSGPYKTLSDVGVSFQKDGTLALDTVKLDKALKAAQGNIAALFSRQATSNSALITDMSGTSATKAGDWHVDITAAATHGAATATNVPAATTVIDATNDRFSLTLDGVDSGTLALTRGSYTPAALATLVQNAINGATAFSAKGITVAVTLDVAGKLKIESQGFGTASTVATPGGTGAAALGFLGTETGAGVNVAGSLTLGGVTYAATGTGQSLIGAIGTPAEGLTLKFTGLPAQVLPGEDGIVSLSDGHASRLATQMDKALGTGGLVAAKTDGLNASIKDIGTRRDVLNTRLDRVEKQLRAQYVALDSLLSRMNTTSSFLTQQLASTTSSK